MKKNTLNRVLRISVSVTKVILLIYIAVNLTTIVNYIDITDTRFENRDIDAIKDMAEWLSVDTADIDCYYRIGDKVYWSQDLKEYREHNPPIAEADANTFVIANGTHYAKDKDHVYYPIGMYDGFEIDLIGWPEESWAKIIEGADPATFKYIGHGIAADKDNMYYKGERIMWDNELLDPWIRVSAVEYTLMDSVSYYFIPAFRFRFLGEKGLPAIPLSKVPKENPNPDKRIYIIKI